MFLGGSQKLVSKWMNIFSWFFINIIAMILIIAGVVYNNISSYNIIAFMMWLLTIGAVVGSFNKDLTSGYRINKFPFPKIINTIYDIAILYILVVYGHFVLGALYLINTLAVDDIFQIKKGA